jgi:hypothetical protein
VTRRSGTSRAIAWALRHLEGEVRGFAMGETSMGNAAGWAEVKPVLALARRLRQNTAIDDVDLRDVLLAFGRAAGQARRARPADAARPTEVTLVFEGSDHAAELAEARGETANAWRETDCGSDGDCSLPGPVPCRRHVIDQLAAERATSAKLEQRVDEARAGWAAADDLLNRITDALEHAAQVEQERDDALARVAELERKKDAALAGFRRAEQAEFASLQVLDESGALLRRLDKYCREDQARTPGTTRLDRCLVEVRDFLAKHWPAPMGGG